MKQISTLELINIIQNATKFPISVVNCIITGAIENVDFSHVRFGRCHFLNVNFTNCKIASCVFSNCQITHINFHNCTLQHSVIKDSTLFNISFLECEISASKIANLSSTKVLFENSSIKHTKLMFSSLIATVFRKSTLLDCILEYSVLDASKFEETNITNSTFSILNMRGVHILHCNISATIFDDINFDDVLNQYGSEFFIPTKYTTINGNTVNNWKITNTVLRTTFTDFLPHSKDKHKVGKSIVKTKKYTYVKNEATRHLLPPNFKARNTKLLIICSSQLLITAIFALLFAMFHSAIAEIEYKQLQTFIEFPVSFIESTVEIHSFAFYASLFYFVISAFLSLITAFTFRNNQGLFFRLIYTLQLAIVCIFSFWVYWENMALKSNVVSIANLLFAFYFVIMLSYSSENN